MSEVKRYLAKMSWTQIETQEHPNGEFVLYSDYSRLNADADHLRDCLADAHAHNTRESVEIELRIETLKAEVDRLEKEVWRMKMLNGINEDTIKGLKAALKTDPEWSKVLESIENNARLEAENRELKTEIERLNLDIIEEQKTVIFVLRSHLNELKEDKEKLIKAGDAVVEFCGSDESDWRSNQCAEVVNRWNAAKEGKPSV